MNFSRSRAKLNLSQPSIQGGVDSGAELAAGVADMSGIYGNNVKHMPKFDEIAATSMVARSNERATAMNAEAQVHSQGLQSVAAVESARIQAEAAKKAAQAEASGSMMGSALGAVGTIGGALIGLSDASTKENIKLIDTALAKLRALNPVTFNYKDEWSGHSERMHHGFIAQDFMKVLPDATYYDESTSKYCIDTADVIGLLVRGIQELETRITQLEAEKSLVGAES